MSSVTRIKRPTTATPRNLKRGTLIHVSTNYAWRHDDPSSVSSPVHFVKVGIGSTYRRAKPKYRYNREVQP